MIFKTRQRKTKLYYMKLTVIFGSSILALVGVLAFVLCNTIFFFDLKEDSLICYIKWLDQERGYITFQDKVRSLQIKSE